MFKPNGGRKDGQAETMKLTDRWTRTETDTNGGSDEHGQRQTLTQAVTNTDTDTH